MQSLGIVSSQGELLVDGIFKLFSLFGDQKKIPLFIEKCNSTKTDSCEKAFELYKCYQSDFLPENVYDDAKVCFAENKLTPDEIGSVKRREFVISTPSMKVLFYCTH